MIFDNRAGMACVLAALLFTASASLPAAAQNGCKNQDFSGWLRSFKQQAAAEGISQRAIERALSGVRFDPGIVKKDRAQAVFAQDFLTFAGRMVNKNRLQHGQQRMKKYSKVFGAIERQYGVPAAVITAFWGLETDFGANNGDGPTLISLATLAYDCRRPELFHDQLMAALRIVDRGDLAPENMRGPWAGELGQVQFLPMHYDEYGVDFDGDGRRDLIGSSADALASAAHYLQSLGWQAGQPWLEEVTVPTELPWDQADLAIKHPRTQWAKWGVRSANGGALKADGLAATLLLPMGRNGPAFLAYPNFDIYLEWNESLVYSTTAAYFATRLAGAPPVSRGGQVNSLDLGQTKQLQKLLSSRGYDVGKIDGIIGANTRRAVKDVQIKLGLPADSYPTTELLQRLR